KGQYIYVNPELNLVIVITGNFLDITAPLKMIDDLDTEMTINDSPIRADDTAEF
ncbi:MAG: hypothetical protein HXS40_09075, partial [Theionarchaea archaeon]|nr:hypothetical protein [Theionarchaea archaeon]